MIIRGAKVSRMVCDLGTQGKQSICHGVGKGDNSPQWLSTARRRFSCHVIHLQWRQDVLGTFLRDTKYVNCFLTYCYCDETIINLEIDIVYKKYEQAYRN